MPVFFVNVAKNPIQLNYRKSPSGLHPQRKTYLSLILSEIFFNNDDISDDCEGFEIWICLMKSTWTVLFYKDTNHTRDGVLWKMHALSFLETFFSSPELKDNELSLWLIFECFSEFNCHVFIPSRTTVSISTKYWKSICERQFSVN